MINTTQIPSHDTTNPTKATRMALHRRRTAALLAAACLGLAACNGTVDPEPTPPTSTPTPTPTATITPTPTPTPTMAPTSSPGPDPATVADDGVVTQVEAQAVIDAGLARFNPPFVAWLSSRAPTESLDADTAPRRAARQLYGEDLAEQVLQRYIDAAPSEFPELVANPTGWRDIVDEVIAANDTCILARTTSDYSNYITEPEPGSPLYVGMRRTNDNAVGWERVIEVFSPEPSGCAEVDRA